MVAHTLTEMMKCKFPGPKTPAALTVPGCDLLSNILDFKESSDVLALCVQMVFGGREHCPGVVLGSAGFWNCLCRVGAPCVPGMDLSVCTAGSRILKRGFLLTGSAVDQDSLCFAQCKSEAGSPL